MVEETFGNRAIKYFKMNVAGKPSLLRGAPEPQLTYEWEGQTQSCILPIPAIEICKEMHLESVKGTVIATYWDGYLRLIEAYGFDSLLYTTNKELELAGRKLQIMDDKLGVLT